MLPSVSQQLESIKTRLEETIVPALPDRAEFAQDQAKFILASLSWILDINEHQYRYEVVENNDYRRGLLALLELQGRDGEEDQDFNPVRDVLSKPAPSPDEASIPLSNVERQNRDLKRLVTETYKMVTKKNPEGAERAKEIMTALALGQGERDRAFHRKTGYLDSPTTLADALYGRSHQDIGERI